jgi:hypothetical protein
VTDNTLDAVHAGQQGLHFAHGCVGAVVRRAFRQAHLDKEGALIFARQETSRHDTKQQTGCTQRHCKQQQAKKRTTGDRPGNADIAVAGVVDAA